VTSMKTLSTAALKLFLILVGNFNVLAWLYKEA